MSFFSTIVLIFAIVALAYVRWLFDKANSRTAGARDHERAREAVESHGPMRARARAQAAAASVEPEVDALALDEQDLVDLEVMRRLDEIQGDRQLFLANDLDGDGMVDSEEWDAARRRIRDLVEAEFAKDGFPSAPPHLRDAPVVEHEPVPQVDINFEEVQNFSFETSLDVVFAEDEEGEPAPVSDEVW